MSVQTVFFDWATSGLDWLKAPYNACAPNLRVIRDELNARFGVGVDLGCHVDRSIRDGSAISDHAYGAALDWRYPDDTKDDVIAWLIDNSAELHVDAIHDYVGCRIWRAGRTKYVTDAHTLWWRAQTPNPNNGMGQAWAAYLHIATNRAGFADTTPIPDRFPPPPEDDMKMAKFRIRGYADQFLAVPLTAGSNERIGAEGQAPVIVTSTLGRKALEAELGYPLTPLPGES